MDSTLSLFKCVSVCAFRGNIRIDNHGEQTNTKEGGEVYFHNRQDKHFGNESSFIAIFMRTKKHLHLSLPGNPFVSANGPAPGKGKTELGESMVHLEELMPANKLKPFGWCLTISCRNKTSEGH